MPRPLISAIPARLSRWLAGLPVHPGLQPQGKDPLGPTLVLALAFLALGVCRLGIPAKLMFDEIHYVPAARRLIELTRRLNPEHPLLGKELIAIGIRLFGDNTFGWRFPNLVAGTLGLFGATRALWWASLSRRASLLFGVLLATNFIWFVLSRIAMLDMAMASMLALGFWQWALAWRKGRRIHLVLTGLFFGLSLGGKWNGAPLMVVPGLLFVWDRARALGLVGAGLAPWRGRQALRSAAQLVSARGVGPVPGVALAEAALWLGLWPLLVYFATFAPAFFYQVQPLTIRGLIPWQRYMLQLQDSVVKPHRYMSRWWQWVFNLRPIWFLYEPINGAQRGVLMIGNPFTMLAGLPALGLCLWRGLRGDRLGLGIAACYALSLVFWAFNGKPVQFYYHYELAAVFLTAALAVVVTSWWDRGRRWPAFTSLALALVLFAGFYPILSAGPLPGRKAYLDYTWLKSWR